MSAIGSVSISPATLTMKEGEYYHLQVSIAPNTASSTDLIWTSLNDYVAGVLNGVIYARHQGTVTITAVSNGSNKVGDSCTVTVLPAEDVPITQIVLNKTHVELDCGESETLSATIYPAEATCKELNWTSSNDYVVGVNNGVINARHQGVATVTAVSTDANKVCATCTVNVSPTGVLIESMTINPQSATVQAGDTLQLTVDIDPDTASNQTLRWVSLNPDVATVNSSTGLVTARAEGTATITAQSTDDSGVTASCTITVPYVPVTSITLDKTSVVLKSGEKVCLTATVHPENASDKGVTWHSDSENTARVTEGTVEARSPGMTSVYALTKEPTGIRGYCNVRVVPANFIPASSVTVTPSECTMIIGDEPMALQATVLPSNATISGLEWSSDNDSVVTVTPGTGVVTVVGVGTAVVTARAKDGFGAKGSCVVSVKQDEVIICRDSDYEIEGFDTDCTYNKVVFTRTGKTWHCIDYDIITNGEDEVYSDRSRLNCYVDPKSNNYTVREYSDEEIRLLYAIDPYGVADYIRRSSLSKFLDNLEDILNYKDHYFELLFNKEPSYYARMIGSDGWVVTSKRTPLNSVLSESELLFGTHPIYDENVLKEVIVLAIDVVMLLLDIAKIGHISIDIISSAFIWLVNGDFSLTDQIFDYCAGEELDAIDKNSSELIELRWADKLLNFYEIAEDFGSVIESTIAQTHFFNNILEYCYANTQYNVVLLPGNGQKVLLRDIQKEYQSSQA